MYKKLLSRNVLALFIFLLSSINGSLQFRFLGCHSEHLGLHKVIPGNYTFRECVEVCQRTYYRYAMAQGNSCTCSNVVGSENDSRSCEDICVACPQKSSLYDVYYTEVVGSGPPQELQVYNVTNTSAYVSWKEPESYLDIRQYVIKAQILHTFSRINLMNQKLIFSNNTFSTELILNPGTKYSVNVYAVSRDGDGIAASRIIETEIGSPDIIPSTPNILKRDSTTMEIQLQPVINNNGPITSYQVLVINNDLNEVVEVDNMKSYSESRKAGLSYYITGEIVPNDIARNFVIGTGQQLGQYFNAPLEPNVNYHILLRAISNYNNVTKSVLSNVTVASLETTLLDDTHVIVNAQQHEIPGIILALYIAIGLASFLLVVGMIGFFFLARKVSNRRRRFTDTQELTIQGPIIEVENNGYIPEEELKPVNHYQNLNKRIWNIPITSLKIEPHSLGIGKFGRITAGSIKKDDKLITVAVYSIIDRKLGERKVPMLKDLDILIHCGKNENVLNLIGICESHDNLFVALEYASMNLKDLLLGSRESLPGRFTDMKELRALTILLGIATGMKHLESLKIVHKQLCARNILVTDEFIPKISGFGLAQYYNPNLVPDYTRWTASEAFTSPIYISKCDVWSYACVVWEICALGGTPYGNIPNNEVPHKITSGQRLSQLPYISDSLYELMLNCWQLNVDERPSFADLTFELENIINDNVVVHLNFSKYPGFQYEQFHPDLELAARTVF